MSTMKTRVLFSSIFFIALSVLRGWTMILNVVNTIVSPADLTSGGTNLVLIEARLVRDGSTRVLGGS